MKLLQDTWLLWELLKSSKLGGSCKRGWCMVSFFFSDGETQHIYINNGVLKYFGREKMRCKIQNWYPKILDYVDLIV